jgi:ABC transporter, permease protein
MFKKYKSVREIRFSPGMAILLTVLILYSLTLILLLVWALITSFKSQEDFRLNILFLPKPWEWNYSFVLKVFAVPVPTDEGTLYVGMEWMFVYGFLYALGCAFAGTFIPCLTAYLCAKFPYKLSKIIYLTVIITMILPIVGSLPSEIQMAKRFGLYDQIWGLWIMKANFLGIYYLIFYNMFKGMPSAYSEAAKIDGAGNFSVLFRIILPLARNTFFTIMLINFIGFWNDYQTPLVYLPSWPTVAYGVFYMSSTNINSLSTVPMRMTSAMLMLIPILIVFLIFHKRLIGNLTMGGIKG